VPWGPQATGTSQRQALGRRRSAPRRHILRRTAAENQLLRRYLELAVVAVAQGGEARARGPGGDGAGQVAAGAGAGAAVVPGRGPAEAGASRPCSSAARASGRWPGAGQVRAGRLAAGEAPLAAIVERGDAGHGEQQAVERRGGPDSAGCWPSPLERRDCRQSCRAADHSKAVGPNWRSRS
jgi:hypothetical protein